MKTLMGWGAMVLISGFAFGDTILENGGPATLTDIPTLSSTPVARGPCWNNRAGDFDGSSTANISYEPTNAGEGVNGDYNDIVPAINATATPEPATFALIGAGLLGLGFVRFPSRKNRP